MLWNGKIILFCDVFLYFMISRVQCPCVGSLSQLVWQKVSFRIEHIITHKSKVCLNKPRYPFTVIYHHQQQKHALAICQEKAGGGDVTGSCYTPARGSHRIGFGMRRTAWTETVEVDFRNWIISGMVKSWNAVCYKSCNWHRISKRMLRLWVFHLVLISVLLLVLRFNAVAWRGCSRKPCWHTPSDGLWRACSCGTRGAQRWLRADWELSRAALCHWMLVNCTYLTFPAGPVLCSCPSPGAALGPSGPLLELAGVFMGSMLAWESGSLLRGPGAEGRRSSF